MVGVMEAGIHIVHSAWRFGNWTGNCTSHMILGDAQGSTVHMKRLWGPWIIRRFNDD